MKQAVAQRNAQLAATQADYNNGYLRIYSGTRPTDADTALSGNTLLAEFRYGATAFPAPSGGVLTANAISSVTIAATGTATFARSLKADGTTVLNDQSVTATGGGGEVQFATTAFVAAATSSLSSLTQTAPVGT